MGISRILARKGIAQGKKKEKGRRRSRAMTLLVRPLWRLFSALDFRAAELLVSARGKSAEIYFLIPVC